MSQYPNSYDQASAGQDLAAAQKQNSSLGFLPELRPSEVSWGLCLRHKNDTRRVTYRTGSSGTGQQIHHHGWLRADNGILYQILYSGQICSPYILLSINQGKMQEHHKKTNTFTAPSASQASNMLHGHSPSNNLPNTLPIFHARPPQSLKLLCSSCRQTQAF